jgi:hypothetical protein
MVGIRVFSNRISGELGFGRSSASPRPTDLSETRVFNHCFGSTGSAKGMGISNSLTPDLAAQSTRQLKGLVQASMDLQLYNSPQRSI